MSDTVAPVDSTAGQTWTDQEHLRLLSISYWCSAGLSLLWGFFGAMYGLILSAVAGLATQGPGAPSATLAFSRFLSIFIGAMCAISILFAAAKFGVGWFLRQRRHRAFCLVVAALECPWIPYGTLLGVSSFLVLCRPSVRLLFDQPVLEPPPAGGTKRRVAVALVGILMAALILFGFWKGSRMLTERIRQRMTSVRLATENFDGTLAKYRGAPHHKAMFASFDNSNGRWAWGWLFAAPRMRDAVLEARKSCESQREKDRLEIPCRLYAVDDEIVVDYSPAALEDLLRRYNSMQGVDYDRD